MSLFTKKNRAEIEYKMYNNVSDTIKLYNGKEINIQNLGDLGLDEKTIDVLKKINERKNLLKEISEFYPTSFNRDKNKELEERLLSSDEYFINMDEQERKRIEAVFENQKENLVRTQEWQSYHMIFMALDELSLVNEAAGYYDKLIDLQRTANNFVEAKGKTASKVKHLEEEKLKKAYKLLDREIEEETAKRDKHKKRYDKLTLLDQKRQEKMTQYQQEYNVAVEKMQQEQQKSGTQVTEENVKKVEDLKSKMEDLENKKQLINQEREKEDKLLKSSESNLADLEKRRNNDELNKVLKEYEDTYRETFEAKKHEIPQGIDEERWYASCNKQLKNLMKKEKLYSGNHKNSKEFNEMIQAMEAVMNYPEVGKKQGVSYRTVLKQLKEKATFYKAEKDKQHRLFPSAMRRTRLAMVDALVNIADRTMDGMTKGEKQVKREKDLAAFFENKGKVEKTAITLGKNKTDSVSIPDVHKMLDEMNKNFKDSIYMEDRIEYVSKRYPDVFSREQLASSLGFESVNKVNNLKLSDVMYTLAEKYNYKPMENDSKEMNTEEKDEIDISI